MNYLDQFLIEVQTLKIAETTFYVKDNVIYDLDEINPELHPDLPLPFQKRKYLDLRHYDQFRSNHEAELVKLQQLALNEILNLNPAQIKLHLKRIEQILHRFDKLYKVFKDEKLYNYYNKSGYPTIDLELKVLCLFHYDKFDATLSHSVWFFADLQDALMFKDGILEGFVSQIKKVLDIDTENKTEAGNNDLKNVFCKSMPIEIPNEHFKVFVERNSKNGKPYLTKEQFEMFIERAFNGKSEMPKLKFNQAAKGEKLLLQTVFYDFYNNYCFEYFNTMQCTDKFIRLLTDNFEGWEFDNVKSNFTPKTKKRL